MDVVRQFEAGVFFENQYADLFAEISKTKA